MRSLSLHFALLLLVEDFLLGVFFEVSVTVRVGTGGCGGWSRVIEM